MRERVSSFRARISLATPFRAITCMSRHVTHRGRHALVHEEQRGGVGQACMAAVEQAELHVLVGCHILHEAHGLTPWRRNRESVVVMAPQSHFRVTHKLFMTMSILRHWEAGQESLSRWECRRASTFVRLCKPKHCGELGHD